VGAKGGDVLGERKKVKAGSGEKGAQPSGGAIRRLILRAAKERGRETTSKAPTRNDRGKFKEALIYKDGGGRSEKQEEERRKDLGPYSSQIQTPGK